MAQKQVKNRMGKVLVQVNSRWREECLKRVSVEAAAAVLLMNGGQLERRKVSR